MEQPTAEVSRPVAPARLWHVTPENTPPSENQPRLPCWPLRAGQYVFIASAGSNAQGYSPSQRFQQGAEAHYTTRDAVHLGSAKDSTSRRPGRGLARRGTGHCATRRVNRTKGDVVRAQQRKNVRGIHSKQTNNSDKRIQVPE